MQPLNRFILCKSVYMHLLCINSHLQLILMYCYWLPDLVVRGEKEECGAEERIFQFQHNSLSLNDFIFAVVKNEILCFFYYCKMSKCYELIWLIQVYRTLRRRIEKWRRFANSYNGLPERLECEQKYSARNCEVSCLWFLGIFTKIRHKKETYN